MIESIALGMPVESRNLARLATPSRYVDSVLGDNPLARKWRLKRAALTSRSLAGSIARVKNVRP